MRTVNLQQHDFAIITAYRNMLIDASKMTLDDRPKELKDLDNKKGVSDPSQFTPYRYTDADITNKEAIRQEWNRNNISNRIAKDEL